MFRSWKDSPNAPLLYHLKEMVGWGRGCFKCSRTFLSCECGMMAAPPVNAYRQTGFRGRTDTIDPLVDGDWVSALDTDWTQAIDTNFRNRLLFQKVNNGVSTHSFETTAQINGGGYFTITSTSSIVRLADSTFFANQDDSTQLIGTLTFADTTNGCLIDTSSDGHTGAVNFGSSTQLQMEIEGNYTIVGSDVADGDIINIRARRGNGVLFNVYDETPAITVSKPTAINFMGGEIDFLGDTIDFM